MSITVQDLALLDIYSVDALRKCIDAGFKDSPKRRDHIFSVADFAKETALALVRRQPQYTSELTKTECAALLHDIGYLPAIREYLDHHTEFRSTQWHPIDGANYLRARGAPALADAIEGHGNSLEVAQQKGLPLFTPSSSLLAKVVTYCDSQTGPTGERVSYTERLEEIRLRKGDTSTSYQAHREAKSRVESIIHEIQELLGGR
jgi:hypothetical protein